LSPADFSGLGGNVLIPSEAGVGTALVTFDGTNYVTQFFDNIPGGTFEGASFADCDVPRPTPTATATATFTPYNIQRAVSRDARGSRLSIFATVWRSERTALGM